jgi:hypothetical protein
MQSSGNDRKKRAQGERKFFGGHLDSSPLTDRELSQLAAFRQSQGRGNPAAALTGDALRIGTIRARAPEKAGRQSGEIPLLHGGASCGIEP